jgi:hypothetical protein
VLRRVAGRLITGPLAFFVAGVIDIGAFTLVTLREKLRSCETLRSLRSREKLRGRF